MNQKIQNRDAPLADTFTAAETQVFGLTIIAGVVAFWFGEPRSYGTMGFFLIAGAITPYILRTYEVNYPFLIKAFWKRVSLLCTPIWILIAQFLLGLRQDPIKALEVGTGEAMLLTLRDAHSLWPVTTRPPEVWTTLFGLCAIYLVLINLLIVPKSRRFFERLLPWLCAMAVTVAVFGFIQAALQLDAPLFTKGTGADDFFAFFPYDGHWAAFATLWMTACFAMALLSINKKHPDLPFIESTAPIYLTGGIILGASALLIEARLPAAALIVSTSLMLLLLSAQFSADREDPHRRPIMLTSGILGTSGLILGIIRIFQPSPESEARAWLRDAALQLLSERPLFGWGLDSFFHLLPFYGSDFLHGARYERVGSDLFQFTAELGIIGFVIPTTIGMILIIGYLSRRQDRQLSNYLLIGCIAVLLLGTVDTPFMSPSVVFSFLSLLFIALRWADLSRHKPGKVEPVSTRDTRSPVSQAEQ